MAGKEDLLAFKIFNLLADGMGGLNWQGLPLICGWLGVEEVDGLMQRLAIIKLHRKPNNKDKANGSGNAEH